MTDFVLMYHPALGNAQALIPRNAANDYETRGWLLVDPNETIPAPVTPYLTKAQADSLYAAAGGGSGAVTPSTVAAAVQSAVDALVGGAPGALNTLNELAAALGDDANFAATVTTALAARATLVGGKVPDNQLPDRLQDLALRAALVPFWTAGETVAAGTVRMTALGVTIRRNSDGTTRGSYDATEAALWTVTGGTGGGGTATTDASQLTTGTLPVARIGDGSLPFTKMTGTLSDGQIPAGIARDTEVTAAVAALVNSAPTTLDTLAEIATALQADESAAATLTTLVGTKANTAALTAETARAQNAEASKLPIFTPSTAYTAGQYILNPQGQIVSALATFTSGASYSSADWQLLTGTIYPSQRPMVPPSRVISRFPSGHGWSGGTDYLTNPLYNDRSLRVTTNGTGGFAYSGPAASTAQDWSSSIIRVIFRVDDPTKANQIGLVVTTGSGNAFAANFNTNGLAGEWCIATINRAQFTVAQGSPVWTGVTQAQFRVKDNATGAINVDFAAIELLPDYASTYPNGVFVLEADDGYASQLSQLRPVTDSLGIPVSLNLIIERIANGASGMALSDLRSLQNYSGWSMSCHANSQAFHNTAGAGATAVTAHADFAAEKQWLHDNGFHSGADHYALCPGTGSPVAEGQVMDQLRADFTSVRVNSGFYETVIPGDRHKLRSVLFSGNTNSQLQANIDACAGPGGMFIFTVHEVLAGATNGTASSLPAIAAANLKTVLQYAQSKGMAFRTRADAMALR